MSSDQFECHDRRPAGSLLIFFAFAGSELIFFAFAGSELIFFEAGSILKLSFECGVGLDINPRGSFLILKHLGAGFWIIAPARMVLASPP